MNVIGQVVHSSNNWRLASNESARQRGERRSIGIIFIISSPSFIIPYIYMECSETQLSAYQYSMSGTRSSSRKSYPTRPMSG